MTPVPAVVVGAGWAPGLSAIRSLGRAGVPVYAVDTARVRIGFHSRYAAARSRPPGSATTSASRAGSRSSATRIGRPAPIFPTHDEDAEHDRAPAPTCSAAASSTRSRAGTCSSRSSKRHQLEARAAQRACRPRVRADGPQRTSSAIPVLVKPSDPVGFRRRFGCRRSAAGRARSWTRRGNAPRAVRAADAGVDSRRGRRRALHARLLPGARTASARPLLAGGSSGRRRPAWARAASARRSGSDEVVEQGLALLRQLGFHGLSQVEFKRDPRDGAYKLMEVNPRLWQWHGLAAACGVDLPLIAYRDLLGERAERRRLARRAASAGRSRSCAASGRRSLRPPYIDAVLRSTTRAGARPVARLVAGAARDPGATSSAARVGCSTRSVRARSASATTCRTARRPGSRSTRGERPQGDDLAEAFFHLARVEERGGRARPARALPAASSAASIPLDPPLERLRRRLGLEPPRWDGARFAVALTHDVDTPWRWTRLGVRGAAARLQGMRCGPPRRAGVREARALAAVPAPQAARHRSELALRAHLRDERARGVALDVLRHGRPSPSGRRRGAARRTSGCGRAWSRPCSPAAPRSGCTAATRRRTT